MRSETLLIEIGTEELPPKSLNNLRKAFQQAIKSGLDKAELKHDGIKSFAAPRRLAVIVQGLANHQPDQSLEKRGPAVASAFDDKGEPTRALAGFMKGCGISDPSTLDTLSTDKGEYLVHRSVKEGQPLSGLLEQIIDSSLGSLPIDRRMRWGKSRVEFVRPVQWLVCLYGKEVIPTSILGKVASDTSMGHRFMGSGSFRISHADDYVKACRENFVLADFDERRQLIREQVTNLASAEKARLDADEDLLDEVTSLVEWPCALAGSFDEKFLVVPAEVLISAMKEHQRYFHLCDENGNLLNRFITVANIESKDSAQVIAGNERVIRPRLADASFFFEQDTRTTLEAKAGRLEKVVFQADLGTYADKALRISKLAGYIAESLGIETGPASRAGLLCKADLVSDMVGEFPDLQGVMGSHYARHDGEPDEVILAIAEHYRPTQSGGMLPDTDIASCVALADKVDTIVGLFGIDQPPTGSRDPFALRRQSLGVIRICIENRLNLKLEDVFAFSADLYEAGFETDEVLRYILERLTSYYADQGITGDAVDAATTSAGSINLLSIDDVVRTLQAFRNGPTAESIVTANKRIANILRKAEGDVPAGFDPAIATEEAEIALASALDDLDLAGSKGAGAKLEKLAVLQEPVDRFFEEVMVMADDKAVRDNRLGLLNALRQRFLEVADFSLLQ